MSRIIAVGDVHLGAHNADAAGFESFLEDLLDDADALDEVVLLGDLWDLIRRDPFGVAWETAGILRRLEALAAAVPVTYLLGNHDVHLRRLDDALYAVDVREEYTLQHDGTSIRFCHGHAFDRLQFDPVSAYLSGPGDRGDIDPTGGRKDPLVAAARDAIGTARRGVRRVLPDGRTAGSDAPVYHRRQRRAHGHLEAIPEDKLVFGHTHRPYVHHDNLAGNPGSWKTTAPVYGTYLAITDGTLELYRYRRDGSDERLA